MVKANHSMREVADVLDQDSIDYEQKIISSGTSSELIPYLKNAVKSEIRVLLVGADPTSNLPAVVSSHTSIPVIGVLSETSPEEALQSFLEPIPSNSDEATPTLIGPLSPKNAAQLAAFMLRKDTPKR
jgi:phosphoribosylcarboxyaminoimidazole (NCAIR) mutase